jgi:S1-C subfamily serine protease
MKVLYVIPGGPAGRAGIRAADDIVSIDGVAVDTPE